MFDTPVSATTSLKKAKDIRNYILKKEEDYEVTIITENMLSKNRVKQLSDLFSSFFNYTDIAVPKFQIISAIPFKATTKELSKTISDFYTKNRVNFKEAIKPQTKIITLGNSLMGITRSNDLKIEGFYDNNFNSTYIYIPELDCFVFPADSTDKIFFNSFEKEFFKYQVITMAEKGKMVNKKTRISKVLVEDINLFYAEHKDDKKIAIDTETSGVDFMLNKIGCVTCSFDGITGYFIKWRDIDTIDFGNFIKDKFQIYANGKFDIKMMLKHGVTRNSLHIDADIINLSHILNEMQNNSLKTSSWLYTDLGGYDFELHEYIKKRKIKNYLTIPHAKIFSYAVIDAIATFQIYEQMMLQLAMIDEVHPNRKGWSISKYYNDIVIPSLNMYIDIEYGGVYINIEKMREAEKELDLEIQGIKGKMLNAFRKKGNVIFDGTSKIKRDKFLSQDITEKFVINPNSGTQMGLFIEHYMKWSAIEMSKPDRQGKSYYLTNDNCLTEWAKVYPLAKVLIEYSSLTTLMNTFVGYESEKSGFWKYVRYHEEDKSYRVHGQFAVMLANSHRNKSYDPNLQNIPSHGAHATLVKKYFSTPSKDFHFMSADFSGLQLRLACIVSDDIAMRDAFVNHGGDLHSKTAVEAIMNNSVSLEDFLKEKKSNEVYADFRFKAKSINFGVIFGSGSSTIMKNIIYKEWTLQECLDYIKDNSLKMKTFKDDHSLNAYFTVANAIRDNFFKTYTGLHNWIGSTKESAKKGYVRSIYGAIRRLPYLTCQDRLSEIEARDFRGQIHRKRIANFNNISLNTRIQNMEIVVVHRTMLKLSKFLKDNNMESIIFGQVHDSIEIYAHKDEVIIIREKLKEIASHPYREYRGIPLEIEGDVSDYFGKNELWHLGKDWEDYGETS